MNSRSGRVLAVFLLVAFGGLVQAGDCEAEIACGPWRDVPQAIATPPSIEMEMTELRQLDKQERIARQRDVQAFATLEEEMRDLRKDHVRTLADFGAPTARVPAAAATVVAGGALALESQPALVMRRSTSGQRLAQVYADYMHAVADAERAGRALERVLVTWIQELRANGLIE